MSSSLWGCWHCLSGSNALGQLPPAGVRTKKERAGDREDPRIYPSSRKRSCRKRHANGPSHSLLCIPPSWGTVSIHTRASVSLALRCLHCFISRPKKERGSDRRHHSASCLHSEHVATASIFMSEYPGLASDGVRMVRMALFRWLTSGLRPQKPRCAWV